MSPFEAVMWDLERDPQMSAAFANLTVLDRPPERERLRARLEEACEAVPRLRRRVVPAPARLAPPEWRDDPDFDLDRHLRFVDLGGDADGRALRDLVAELIAEPLDPRRPLWEFVVVEGLADGRAAMLQRLHHSITDGEGGIRMSVAFLDLERHPPARADGGTAARRDPGGATPGHWTTRAVGAALHAARSGAGALTGALGAAGSVARHPDQLPGRVGDVVGVARVLASPLAAGRHRSPLWTARSTDRWFGTTELDLEQVRAAAHTLGGSVNDLFVAGAAAAAGAYHRRAGSPVPELRVAVPVSTRHGRGAASNAFAPAHAVVPTGELTPVDRVRAVRVAMDTVKAQRSLGAAELAASAVRLLPPPVIVRAGRLATGAVDFVCSNVRAAPFDLYLGGALIEANYPVGPLAGTAFNLTTMSYRGTLFLGLTVDRAAVGDPPGLLADLEDAYLDLLRAGGVVVS